MITWAYISGFFDGEGTISVNSDRQWYTYQCSIAQSGPVGRDALEALRTFLREHGIIAHIRQKKMQPHQTLIPYVLYLTAKCHVTAFLGAMLPYLLIKKVKAQDTLRFLRIYKSKPSGRRSSHSRIYTGRTGGRYSATTASSK